MHLGFEKSLIKTKNRLENYKYTMPHKAAFIFIILIPIARLIEARLHKCR